MSKLYSAATNFDLSAWYDQSFSSSVQCFASAFSGGSLPDGYTINDFFMQAHVPSRCICENRNGVNLTLLVSQVVHRFRQGGFNTLVSTCVGEEGLDIGEVDLIVCFDAQKNPIRLVQRMGRTGRKRQGRIVVVLAEGREERVGVAPRNLKWKV